MSEHYILVGHDIQAVSLMEWANWMETASRNVEKTTINGKLISTVFLGLDHQFGDGPPLLFETMVFPEGKWSELYCRRSSTWDEAEAEHAKACEWVESGCPEA